MDFNPISVLSDFQIAEFKEVFELFDIDKDGAVSNSELKLIFLSLGQQISDYELKLMIEKVDKDENGTLDFSEFLSLMAEKLVKEDENYEYYKIFRQFDKDCSGSISSFELRLALLGRGTKDELIQQINEEADSFTFRRLSEALNRLRGLGENKLMLRELSIYPALEEAISAFQTNLIKLIPEMYKGESYIEFNLEYEKYKKDIISTNRGNLIAFNGTIIKVGDYPHVEIINYKQL